MNKYQESLDWVSAGNDSCGEDERIGRDMMKKDLIELEEVGGSGSYIVNINNITFHTGWHFVFINGVVNGTSHSRINITKESHERLMKMAKERLWIEDEK